MINEHFNWLAWGIGYFFHSLIYADPSLDRANVFKHEELSLPPVDSLEWLNGFEWKGIYIRIQPESESKHVEEELKCLRIAFIEYLQVIEMFSTEKIKNSKILSNEIIFPLVTTIKLYGMILLVTASIPSINGEDSRIFGFNDKNKKINNNGSKTKEINIKNYNINNANTNTNSRILNFTIKDKQPTNNSDLSNVLESYTNNNISENYLFNHDIINDSKFYEHFGEESKISIPSVNKEDISFQLNNPHISNQYVNNNISSQINYQKQLQMLNANSNMKPNENEFDYKIENLNYSLFSIDNSLKQMNFVDTDELDSYYKEDLMKSFIFKNINEKNLVKVVNESYNLQNQSDKYFANYNEDSKIQVKYLLTNAKVLIPNLIDKDDDYSAFVIPENDSTNIEFIENNHLHSYKELKMLLSKIFFTDEKIKESLNELDDVTHNEYINSDSAKNNDSAISLSKILKLMFSKFELIKNNGAQTHKLDKFNDTLNNKTNQVTNGLDYLIGSSNTMFSFYENLCFKIAYSKYNVNYFLDNDSSNLSKKKTKQSVKRKITIEESTKDKTKKEPLHCNFLKYNSRINDILTIFIRNININNYTLFINIKKSSFYSRLTNINDVLNFTEIINKINFAKGKKFNNTKRSLESTHASNKRVQYIKKKSKENHLNNNSIKNNNYSYNNNTIPGMPCIVWGNNNTQFNLSEVKGPVMVISKLKQSIKLDYSLIPSINMFENDLFNKSAVLNFNLHLENFIKVLNSSISLENLSALNNLFIRYSIPSEFKFFIIPKIKISKISDLIKIDFLLEIVRNSMFFQEGINFITKMYYINWNNHLNPFDIAMKENLTVVNDGFYPFIKEKNLFNIYREKVYQMILSFFALHKAQPAFVSFFFEKINTFYFMKLVNIRILGKALFLGKKNSYKEGVDDELLNSYQDLLSSEYIELFLKNLILTANEKPFLFLSSVESVMQIGIEPNIKFKASISKDQFIEAFTSSNCIFDKEIVVESFIHSKDLISYLYTDISPSEEDMESVFPDEDMNHDNIGVLGPKIPKTIGYNNKKNSSENKIKTVKSKIQEKKNSINSNNNINLTGMTQPNLKTISDISDNDIYLDIDNKTNDRDNISEVKGNRTFVDIKQVTVNTTNNEDNISPKEKKEIRNLKIVSKLLSTSDLSLSPFVYKLKINSNLLDLSTNSIINNEDNVIFSHFKYRYAVNSIKYLRDWRNRVDLLIDNVVSIYMVESGLMPILQILFFHYFFIEKEFTKCKDFLSSMKEFIKNSVNVNIEDIMIVSLLEGLIIERNNYIEAEGYYSMAVALSLVLIGDPRGRGSLGNPINYFPTWKLARQTSILESAYVNENFKELFHCQDYCYRALKDINLFLQKLENKNYSNNNYSNNSYTKLYQSLNNPETENNDLMYKYLESQFHSSFFNRILDTTLVLCKNEEQGRLNLDFHKKLLINNSFGSQNKSKLNLSKTHYKQNNENYMQTDYADVDENISEETNNRNIIPNGNNNNYPTEKKVEENRNIFYNKDGISNYIAPESYVLQENPCYNFPSISNPKINNKVLNSQEFVIPFFHWIMNFSMNKSDTHFNEDYFEQKIGVPLVKSNSDSMNIHPTLTSFRSTISPNVSNTNINAQSNIFENLKEQSLLLKQNNNATQLNRSLFDKNNLGKATTKPIFSTILYEILLKKLSFKSSPPKGFALAFGDNKYCQTSHSNYDILSFPRHCFKLKDETIDKIACGSDHTTALTRARSVYCWGNNAYGQCGVNPLLNQIGNNYQSLLSNVNSLIATINSNKLSGNSSFLNLNSFSQMISFVMNKSNYPANVLSQNNIAAIISTPVKINGVNSVNQISAGNEFSTALDITGNVFSWGKEEGGALGYSINTNSNVEAETFSNNHVLNNINNFTNSIDYEKAKLNNIIQNHKLPNYCYIPKQVQSIKNIKYICSGSFHNIAIDNKYKTYTWGSGEGGQLGLASEALMKISESACISTPTAINSLEGVKLNKVSSGEAHSLALTLTGDVYGWGYSSFGQLGLGFCADSFEPGMGDHYSKVFEPRKLIFKNNQIKKDSIQKSSKNKTNVNALGVEKEKLDQIETKNPLFETLETNNDEDEQPHITDLVCGKTFSMFVDKKGKLYGCGNNDYGQIGMSNEIEISRSHLFNPNDDFYSCNDIVFPRQLEIFSKMKVKKISCGEGHCLAIVEDSLNQVTSVWSWGMNKSGQLGHGNNLEISSPKPISYLYEYNNCRIVDVACGSNFSICLFSNFSQSRTNNVNVS